MKIQLSAGERIFIAMEDAEDPDDGIMIEYDFQKSGSLTVSANVPDDLNRDGVLYSANVDGDERTLSSHIPTGDPDKDRIAKKAVCVSCGSDFSLTQGEIDFMKNLFGDDYKEPIRCKRCREIRARRKKAMLPTPEKGNE
jgi:hypothetical protein